MYVYLRKFDRSTRLRYNYTKNLNWDRKGNYVKSWDRKGNYVKSWDRKGNYVKSCNWDRKS